MSANALFARVTRMAPVAVLLALGIFVIPASAQLASGPAKPRTAASAATPPVAPAQTILHIVVKGTQRIEPATVLSYISLHEGDAYQPQTADRLQSGPC